jgi:uncharacterized protein
MRPDEKVIVMHGRLGRGVHARYPIVAGERILEFDGPVLTHDQVRSLGGTDAYSFQVGADQYIDARPPGRFANHSCEPNAGVSGDRFLVALRDIAAAEEIQFDYSTTMSATGCTIDCRCGRPRCRRLIRDFHFLPPSLQAYYVRLGLVQSFIVREWRAKVAAERRAADPQRMLRMRQA